MRVLGSWLASRWVVAAGFMAAAMLAVLPLLVTAYPAALVLIYLHGPAYMVHQVEEHAGDRFRTFVNRQIFGGRDALGIPAVLVINIPVVWGLNLAALYAAHLWGPGAGLVAPYAMLINGLSHIGATLRFRVGNPGVVTSVLVFLPLSVAALAAAGPVGLGPHAAGLGLAVFLHLAIIVHILRRARRLVA